MLRKPEMTKENPKNRPGMKPQPKIVVIGVGNLLLKDEGIGIHTAKTLQEMNLPDNVRIIDGGTSPDLIAFSEAGDK